MALWEAGPLQPGDASNRYIPTAIRDRIYDRDGYVCRYCGRYGDTIDHVYPRVLKGTNHETNLVVACQSCNSIAGEKPFTEFFRKKAYILQRRLDLYGEGIQP